jgi:hypothetical protein
MMFHAPIPQFPVLFSAEITISLAILPIAQVV